MVGEEIACGVNVRVRSLLTYATRCHWQTRFRCETSPAFNDCFYRLIATRRLPTFSVLRSLVH